MVSGFFVACIARQLLERALIFNNLKPCDDVGTNRQIFDLSADAIRDECKGVAGAMWPRLRPSPHFECIWKTPTPRRKERDHGGEGSAAAWHTGMPCYVLARAFWVHSK